MIIDSHVHLDSYTKKKILPEMLDALILDMNNFHIDKAIIMTATHSPAWGSGGIMEIIALLQSRNLLNTRFFVLGSVPSQFSSLDHLEQLMQQKLIVGIKLYPGYEDFFPSEPRFSLLYELCLKYDLPCFFHSGSTFAPLSSIECADPLHLDKVALRYPQLRMVICHLGMPWYQTCAMLLERHKNMYADISGFLTPDSNEWSKKILKDALFFIKGYVGDLDKVLFGTDWKICGYEMYREFIQELNLTKDEVRKLMEENVKKVLTITL